MAVTNAGRVAVPPPGLGLIARMRAWRKAGAKLAARLDRTEAVRSAGVQIGSAERILATAHDRVGSPVVATSSAVYVPVQAGDDCTWRRLGWEDIDTVRWDERTCALALAGLRPGGAWREELALESDGALVDVTRERVTATRLASRTVRLDDHVHARVTARRQPGSGRPVWSIVLNGPADLADPAVLAKVHGAISAIQEAAGLPIKKPLIRFQTVSR